MASAAAVKSDDGMNGAQVAALAAVAELGGVTLDELGEAALMNRLDRKFLVPAAGLPQVLTRLGEGYRVLEVGGRRLSAYHTRYFDTPELAFYHAHHSGRGRRYKVRVRSYGASQLGFLEVKLKTRAGRTLKERHPLDSGEEPLNRLDAAPMLGVAEVAPPMTLREVVCADFSRMTLVRRDAAERVTFDLALCFRRGGDRRDFPGVVVAEVKQAQRASSPFLDAMRGLGLRELSLSKYCAAVAILEPGVKTNRFRETLRRLERIGASATESL